MLERFCGDFEQEPAYEVQCTCGSFLSADIADGSVKQLLDVVRKSYPVSIARTKTFEELGKIFGDAVAEDIIKAGEIEKSWVEQKRKNEETS